MIHVRIEAVEPNYNDVVIDTVMPARGMPRYDVAEGKSGKIELEIIVDSNEDLIKRAMQICDKIAELDFCYVERPWVKEEVNELKGE